MSRIHHMLKNIIIFISFFLLNVNTILSHGIYTKDGMLIGYEDELMSECMNNLELSLINIGVEGVFLDIEKACSCFIKEVYPLITSYDFQKIITYGAEAFFTEDLSLLEIMSECALGNAVYTDSFLYKKDKVSDALFEAYIKLCAIELVSDYEFSHDIAYDVCDCSFNRLYTSEYTHETIKDIDNEHGLAFNEIALPCLNEVIKKHMPSETQNDYSAKDIKGGEVSTSVKLINYLNQGYKLKISIAGISKYFLFDTGASDLIINRNFERKLLIEGALNKSSYLGNKTYLLADNSIVEGQLVKINNIKIGNYIVDNVIVAIIDEGGLLCGKSFLDKFKKWEIDKDRMELILYK